VQVAQKKGFRETKTSRALCRASWQPGETGSSNAAA